MKTGPKPKCKVGDVYVVNCGWECEVVEYINAGEITVKWSDGSKQRVRFGNLKRGSVKPLNYKSVYGMGFFGVGRFVPRSYKPKDGEIVVDSRIYGHWVKLLDRVYNLENKHSASNRTYKGCTIDESWHNFQNFCEWTITQKYWQEPDACLDKDLIVEGNKHYSSDTCCYLHNNINVFISGCKVSDAGLPRGVNRIKPKTSGSKVGYVARCYFKSDREYLGYFNTVEQAFAAYSTRKKAVALDLCRRYSGLISETALNSLLRYSSCEYVY